MNVFSKCPCSLHYFYHFLSRSQFLSFAKATVILCSCTLLSRRPQDPPFLSVSFPCSSDQRSTCSISSQLSLIVVPHPQAHVPRLTCSCINLCSLPLPLFILHHTEPAPTPRILSEPIAFLTFSSWSLLKKIFFFKIASICLMKCTDLNKQMKKENKNA